MENVIGNVAGICITLNYSGKQKRNMVIRSIKVTGQQPAGIKLPRRVHPSDAWLHYRYIGMSELR